MSVQLKFGVLTCLFVAIWHMCTEEELVVISSHCKIPKDYHADVIRGMVKVASPESLVSLMGYAVVVTAVRAFTVSLMTMNCTVIHLRHH